MSDLLLNQIIERLEDRRDHGPNDIHELTYQLALQVKALRDQLEMVRDTARRALTGLP